MKRYVLMGPITDGTLNKTNQNFKVIFDKSGALQTQLNNLVIKDGTSNAEVAQSRGEYPVLNERLNAVDEELADKAKKKELMAKADKSYVDDKVDSIDRGFGGTYSTLAELKSIFPTGDTKRYVVSEDGHWYYWIETGWTSGGLYQAQGIADKSVKVESTDFIRTSKNLVGKENLIGTTSIRNGVESFDSSVATSKFISCIPNAIYSCYGISRITYFTLLGVYISATDPNPGITSNRTTPANAYYMKVLVPNAYINFAQINEGATLQPYEVFTVPTMDKKVRLAEGEVTKENVDFIIESTNLVSLETLTFAGTISSAGAFAPNTTHRSTDFIRVKDRGTYTYVGITRLSYYDINKAFISAVSILGENTYTRGLPEGVYYARFTCALGHVDTVQVNEGFDLLPRVPANPAHIDPDLIKIKDESIEKKHLSPSLIGVGGDILDSGSIYGLIAKSQPRLYLPKPMLVMSYDDNPITDYTLAFPVHKRHNVPGELSIISGFLTGEINHAHLINQPSFAIEEGLEMQKFGFEAATHSFSHKSVGVNGLNRSTLRGGKKWYVGDHYKWNRVFPYKARIYHRLGDDKEDIVTIIGEGVDAEGDYLLSQEGAVYDHNTSAFFTLTKEELYREIVQSAADLRNLGFDVSSMSYPYNANSYLTRDIVSEYLSSGRSGSPQKTGVYMDTENSYLPTAQLNSYAEITSWTQSEIDSVLKETKENNAFSMVFEHTWRGNFSVDGLDYVFEKAKELGVEITTRKEAMKYHANRFEVGDYLKDREPYVDAESNYVMNAFGREFKDIVKP